MQARTIRSAALLVGAGLVLAACAAGGNDAAQAGGADSVGFWWGLWHGLISPITFLVSLFSDDVGLYEIHNDGGWYDFGFMVGVSVVFSGAARSGAARARPTTAPRRHGGPTR
ncbi:hypothetical protein [uncultured Cellulomonas sp.]|uniref:hypothetical protein n=1 Tax=uncultured Cellulomonas sp. TaxID=189682 RepID=UPI00262ECB6E|nr:hypothetical protein [uncultured Cellulomonas sp.]